ncbi:DUF2550 family protein [Georgenia subflava]|uniref:DUF2550 family protein n=1 Tax=Georgenia subflava TaxID=1622177 RepID=A0A6N7EIB4_9MICO|nr:DUF2550 family protein [Georgenia subflava]MPV38132.1 DUF2550 family protein [Georgenia subflava]
MTGAGAGWVAASALVLVLVVGLVLFAVRVRRLGRRIGSFECARRPAGQRDWTSGLAVYGVGRIDWYRLVSLRMRPSRSFVQQDLVIVDRVRRGSADQVVEARCRHRGEEFELAMVATAYSGLVSWLEAAPPRDPRRWG